MSCGSFQAHANTCIWRPATSGCICAVSWLCLKLSFALLTNTLHCSAAVNLNRDDLSLQMLRSLRITKHALNMWPITCRAYFYATPTAGCGSSSLQHFNDSIKSISNSCRAALPKLPIFPPSADKQEIRGSRHVHQAFLSALSLDSGDSNSLPACFERPGHQSMLQSV